MHPTTSKSSRKPLYWCLSNKRNSSERKLENLLNLWWSWWTTSSPFTGESTSLKCKKPPSSPVQRKATKIVYKSVYSRRQWSILPSIWAPNQTTSISCQVISETKPANQTTSISCQVISETKPAHVSIPPTVAILNLKKGAWHTHTEAHFHPDLCNLGEVKPSGSLGPSQERPGKNSVLHKAVENLHCSQPAMCSFYSMPINSGVLQEQQT